MIEGVGSQYQELEIAEDVLLAVTGMLTGAEVRLFINDFEPDRESVIGDYDPPTYTGNGDEAITWNAPSVSDDGTVEVVGTLGEFRPTDAVAPNDVFGAIILDGGGGLLDAVRFPAGPLPMNSALDSILLVVRWRPSTARFSVELVS